MNDVAEKQSKLGDNASTYINLERNHTQIKFAEGRVGE